MPKEAQAAHGWCNGAMFDTNWYKDNVTFNNKRMQLNLDVEDGPGWSIPGINYSGAEFRTFTQNRYHYGLYEVCMKPAKSDGIVSSFFTYTGPYDEPKTQWDEIDIEFLGKDTTKAQFNYLLIVRAAMNISVTWALMLLKISMFMLLIGSQILLPGMWMARKYTRLLAICL